jgi:hypothetical protein
MFSFACQTWGLIDNALRLLHVVFRVFVNTFPIEGEGLHCILSLHRSFILESRKDERKKIVSSFMLTPECIPAEMLTSARRTNLSDSQTIKEI